MLTEQTYLYGSEGVLSFLKDYKPGIYRIQLISTLEKGRIKSQDKEIFSTNLNRAFSDSDGDYIQTPQEFFQRWLNGRLDNIPSLDSFFSGFELQLPSLRTEKFDNGHVFKKIEGLVIASDFGYSGDFHDDLAFAINDISSQRVLTYYEEEDQLKIDLCGRKELTTDFSFALGTDPKYPFTSINPAKSNDYTWSLINISPNKVYQALRDIGFEW